MKPAQGKTLDQLALLVDIYRDVRWRFWRFAFLESDKALRERTVRANREWTKDPYIDNAIEKGVEMADEDHDWFDERFKSWPPSYIFCMGFYSGLLVWLVCWLLS